MKRLGIFVFYDPYGIVDRYAVYLLQKIQAFLDKLVIICNGKLEEREKIAPFTQDIYIRPNLGFDAAAWQYAFLNLISRTELCTYDEVVLFNDTFFGPIYPLEHVFEKMGRKNCDFWGLTAHAESIDPMGACPYGYWPAHVQTYFWAVRKELFCSQDFYHYWEELPVCRTFEEVVCMHEARFTKYFEDLGYTWDVYLDMREIDQREQVKATHYVIDQYQLLADDKFPFYKRKNIITPKSHYLEYHNASYVRKSMEYIKANTGYDIGLIIENILRLYDIGEIKESMDLTYVVPNKYTVIPENEKDFPIHGGLANHSVCAYTKYAGRQTAVVMYITKLDEFAQKKSYIQNLPESVDLILAAEGEAAADTLQKDLGGRAVIRRVEKTGNELTAFFIDCRKDLQKYDYICFIHDHISAASGSYYRNAKSYEDSLWENMLAGGCYIENVVSMFEKDPYLGLLLPPAPIHGSYFYTLHDPWCGSFQTAFALAGWWDVSQYVKEDKWPVSYGNVFWCRRKAVRQVIEKFPEKKDAGEPAFMKSMEKLYPYIAQKNGYYTAEIMTGQQAELYVNNLRCQVKASLKKFKENSGAFGSDWSSYLAADALGQWGIKKTAKHLAACICKKIKHKFDPW